MAQRILSIMAHPDDAEFLCAGTLIRLQKLGWEVHIASMTPGDCGSRTLPPEKIARIRQQEARASAAKVGGVYHCLDCRDLVIHYKTGTIRRTVELVRQVDPTVVVTHSPQDYMPDHEMTSLLARNACFGAPAPNFKTPSRATGSIPYLYYAAPIEGNNIFGEPVPQSLFIDISEVIDLKAEMLACHASQRDWLRAQHGVDEYLAEMRHWSEQTGARIGVPYAEGFRQHRGHAYPQGDLLGQTLGGCKC